MKLFFKQRFFSWFDSFDIYDENGNMVFEVKGQLSWGHLLKIYNKNYEYVGKVKERVITFLPKFEMYEEDVYIGEIKKELTLFKDRFILDFNNWKVSGDIFDWNYEVKDNNGNLIMTAKKEIFRLTDTYVLDIVDEKNKLYCLMIVLAIDAAKCSSNAS